MISHARYYEPKLKTFYYFDFQWSLLATALKQKLLMWRITEEVLSSNQALWMSDDGHLMLYGTFNDTLVEEQRFPWFAVQDEGKLYPEIRSLRYPKVK